MSANPLPKMPIWTDHGYAELRNDFDPFGDAVVKLVLSWWYDGFHFDGFKFWW